jgi:hypothetical protein
MELLLAPEASISGIIIDCSKLNTGEDQPVSRRMVDRLAVSFRLEWNPKLSYLLVGWKDRSFNA